MENNKREWPPVRRPRRRGINIRPVALLLALVLLIGGAIGGVIAWLTDNSGPVENTFTVGNIDIDLAESQDLDLKMVPGCDIVKDPLVTVVKDSEACWLFVEITESANLDNFITYAVADGWTELEGVEGVYYREVGASDDNQEFAVLANDKVTVKTDVTKAMMDAINDGTATDPTLTFTAYAVQYWKTNGKAFTPAEAWAKIGTP